MGYKYIAIDAEYCTTTQTIEGRAGENRCIEGGVFSLENRTPGKSTEGA